jgi:hypothetical protein
MLFNPLYINIYICHNVYLVYVYVYIFIQNKNFVFACRGQSSNICSLSSHSLSHCNTYYGTLSRRDPDRSTFRGAGSQRVEDHAGSTGCRLLGSSQGAEICLPLRFDDGHLRFPYLPLITGRRAALPTSRALRLNAQIIPWDIMGGYRTPAS